MKFVEIVLKVNCAYLYMLGALIVCNEDDLLKVVAKRHCGSTRDSGAK